MIIIYILLIIIFVIIAINHISNKIDRKKEEYILEIELFNSKRNTISKNRDKKFLLLLNNENIFLKYFDFFKLEEILIYILEMDYILIAKKQETFISKIFLLSDNDNEYLNNEVSILNFLSVSKDNTEVLYLDEKYKILYSKIKNIIIFNYNNKVFFSDMQNTLNVIIKDFS